LLLVLVFVLAWHAKRKAVRRVEATAAMFPKQTQWLARHTTVAKRYNIPRRADGRPSSIESGKSVPSHSLLKSAFPGARSADLGAVSDVHALGTSVWRRQQLVHGMSWARVWNTAITRASIRVGMVMSYTGQTSKNRGITQTNRMTVTLHGYSERLGAGRGSIIMGAQCALDGSGSDKFGRFDVSGHYMVQHTGGRSCREASVVPKPDTFTVMLYFTKRYTTFRLSNSTRCPIRYAGMMVISKAPANGTASSEAGTGQSSAKVTEQSDVVVDMGDAPAPSAPPHCAVEDVAVKCVEDGASAGAASPSTPLLHGSREEEVQSASGQQQTVPSDLKNDSKGSSGSTAPGQAAEGASNVPASAAGHRASMSNVMFGQWSLLERQNAFYDIGDWVASMTIDSPQRV
jgi:hypothetical protein